MAKRTEAQLVADIAIPQALEAWKEKMNRSMAEISAKYPDNERLSWPQLQAQAQAYIADNAATVPMLSAAASVAGIPTIDLANTVIANAAAFETAIGQLTGQRIAGDAQINACTTLAEIETVKTSLGI
jgi:hypothetical protein